MTISNGYATLLEVRAELGNYVVADTSDDSRLEVAVESASRQIDAHCGRRFWQDATAQAREYWADDAYCVYTDDISTTSGLIVKTDSGGDGTFATTLTITTDFIVKPTNAGDESPVRPYTEIAAINGSFTYSSRRPDVQVTAKFGWPAVPMAVKRACLIQAVQLFKAADAAFGVLQFGEGYSTRVPGLNPMAAALLEGYCLPRVA